MVGAPETRLAWRTITRWATVIAITALPLGAVDRAGAQEAAPSALSETYQDWVVECATAQTEQKEGEKHAGKRVCQISQSLLQANSRERVLTIAFVVPSDGKGGLSGSIVAPFGLDLQSGIKLRVEKETLLNGSFKTCLPQGCLAPLTADDKVEQALRDSAKLLVEMTAADSGQRVDLSVSLKGFSQSLDRLKTLAATTEQTNATK